MELRGRYAHARAAFLQDKGICKENQKLFKEFLDFEEYKLKRIRGRPSLDENSYKTLMAYISRLRTVNNWFKNKSWCSLTKADIKRVYDDLEDGKIKTQRGKPVRDKRSYYNHIIRSKPFEMAGKKELVDEVMQFGSNHMPDEVRFITESDFRRLIEVIQKPKYRLFFWLCWDIGENGRSLLKLQKRDCMRQINEHAHEPEYIVNLRRETLKRSRRPRSELTNYKETVVLLDSHLKYLSEDKFLFDFGEGSVRKVLHEAAQKSDVRCSPNGQHLTLKDFRSSMGCDLLSKGWSRDEVNARLGHAPSSSEIDRYVNYLAIDRTKPKKKLQDNQISKLMSEVEAMKDREKLAMHRLEKLKTSSQTHMEYLAELVKIHSKMSALHIAHAQGKMGEQEYARALVKCYNDLAVQRERESSALFNWS